MKNPRLCKSIGFTQVVKDDAGRYHVYVKDVEIGSIDLLDDGFFQFFPDLGRGGFWPSYLLREIAEIVDALNLPWEVQLDEYFRELEKKNALPGPGKKV